MTSHLKSSSIELWLIIEQGLYVHNPKEPTRGEVVKMQTNATALHMINQGLGDKEATHFEHLDTAKEVWDALDGVYVGNESMKKNQFNALSNEAEGFYMLDVRTTRTCTEGSRA